jgi:hypothetical protein
MYRTKNQNSDALASAEENIVVKKSIIYAATPLADPRGPTTDRLSKFTSVGPEQRQEISVGLRRQRDGQA